MPWQPEKETEEVEESARGGQRFMVTIGVDDAQHAHRHPELERREGLAQATAKPQKFTP